MSQAVTDSDLSAMLGAYPKDRRYALAVMQDMQRRYNFVPGEGLKALAGHFNCPLAELYAMATFYKAFSLKPKGRHIIKVCDGTACHLRGSKNLLSGIRAILGIGPGETTADGEFSLETVNCMGSCALAPVMVVDGAYYGRVKLESLPGVFAAVSEGAAV